jgi:trehalose 6-phosphate phosphatase
MVAPERIKRLQKLSLTWAIAVITGRSVSDAQPRLGFKPRYIAGNHGAEHPTQTAPNKLNRSLNLCRALLLQKSKQLDALNVEVEDKGLSLALHYRQAHDPLAARRWLDELFALHHTPWQADHGHCVLNITPAGAPNKGDALMALMRDCKAATLLVIGDDCNDEPAFIKTPPGSVSVRIGPVTTPTRAQFRLNSQSEIDDLLGVLG